MQNLIEVGAFDAMAPRKSGLIFLPLNGGSQQLNNFVIIKYERLTAYFGLVSKAERITGLKSLSPSHGDTQSLRRAFHALHR
ncbi:MAG: hypothetical protein WBX95_13675, partial [Xanthobacteraceae bacterium]